MSSIQIQHGPGVTLFCVRLRCSSINRLIIAQFSRMSVNLCSDNQWQYVCNVNPAWAKTSRLARLCWRSSPGLALACALAIALVRKSGSCQPDPNLSENVLCILVYSIEWNTLCDVHFLLCMLSYASSFWYTHTHTHTHTHTQFILDLKQNYQCH